MSLAQYAVVPIEQASWALLHDANLEGHFATK